MTFKQSMLLLFVLLGFSSFGQMTVEYDTLRLGKNILGITDSLDYNSGDIPTTFDGGRSILSEKGLSLVQFSKDYRRFRFQPNKSWRKMQFSALPYIGFAYTFGGNGTQFLSANYVQAFNDSLLFNMQYQRIAGVGFIRNSSFTSNNLRFQVEWKTNYYSMQLRGAYISDTLQHSGGLDSLDVALGLEFASVKKQDAASKSQLGLVELTNYFNFNPKSAITIGLVTKHTYEISERRYHESGVLTAIYMPIYIDPILTSDRFTHASISNESGLFFSKYDAYIDGRLSHKYWRVGNLGNTYDTTEIDLNSSMRWKKNGFNFSNKFHFNILGGYNAIANNFGVEYDVSKWRFGGTLDFENLAPTVIKRSYFSNAFTYNQSEIKLQQMLHVNTSLTYKVNNDSTIIKASASFLQLNNTYLFNDSTWYRSDLSISAVQLQLKAKMSFGKFHVQPKFIYTAQTQNYIPSIQGYLRFYRKSTVFKAKKLVLVLGVDASFISSFNHRIYTPAMDAFTWYKTPGVTNSMVNLHAFTAIEISTFRFYIRFDNIGAFWNNPINEEVANYPLSGSRLRVGITWDFFN